MKQSSILKTVHYMAGGHHKFELRTCFFVCLFFSWNMRWFQRNYYLFLSLSHGKELQLVATKAWPLSQLHQITSRIRARTENEDDWRERVGLLENRLKTNHGRGHVLLAHSSCHEIRDGQVNPVHAEATQEKKALEVCQLLFVTAGEGGGFRRVVVTPLEKKNLDDDYTYSTKVWKIILLTDYYTFVLMIVRDYFLPHPGIGFPVTHVCFYITVPI